MNTKFCQSCGAEINEKAEICPKCGVRVANSPIDNDKKSQIVAALLAIFIGTFGIHRFYLGQTGLGLTYLLSSILLCWTIIVPLIFMVISVVDFIVIIVMNEDKFNQKFNQ